MDATLTPNVVGLCCDRVLCLFDQGLSLRNVTMVNNYKEHKIAKTNLKGKYCPTGLVLMRLVSRRRAPTRHLYAWRVKS